MKKYLLATALGLSTAVATMAHSNVADPTVKARMDAMSAIGASLKTLGGMAQGAVAFDAEAANAALAVVAAKAAETPALFEAQKTDPTSEARPEIWANWDDFVAKAEALEAAASVTVTDQASVGAALGALGGTCKACHAQYRM